jgi:hypothetical protein
MVEEILLLIENLNGISSTIKSDHILNLIPEVEGVLPRDKEKMISALKWYLELNAEEQMIFRVGRRTGIMNSRYDLSEPNRRKRVRTIIKENNITVNNVDEIIDETMKRFI